MQNLSDELLHAILSPPLQVPDHQFCDASTVSPFSKAGYSAADVLLVCKRWMRVATPGLYETVIIRSPAQALALRIALERNPDFGRYTKRLRLEGAYGEHLRTALETMTRIDDFCFTLTVSGTDKITSLVKAIQTCNPKQVILTLPRDVSNTQRRTLVSKLCFSIGSWTNLRYFHFSSSSPAWSSDAHTWSRELVEDPDIINALTGLKHLDAVYVSITEYTYHRTVPHLQKFLTQSPARVILRASYDDPSQVAVFRSFPDALKSRLYILDNHPNSRPRPFSQPENQCSSNPFYKPMSQFSTEARIEIWVEIFKFAVVKSAQLLPDFDQSPRLGWTNKSHIDMQTARSLYLVCREFHIAILRILFENISINCEADLLGFKFHLGRASHLGRSIRVFRAFGTADLDLSYSSMTGVRSFAAWCTQPSSLTLLTETSHAAGHSLRTLELHGVKVGGEVDHPSARDFSPPSVFSGFNALEVLHWDFEDARFSTDNKLDLLPNLQHIIISRAHPTFFSMLARWSLPKLTRIELCQGVRKGETLLKAHGRKVKSLVAFVGLRQSDLDACPSLTSLELLEEVQPSVLESLNHAGIRELRFHWNTGAGKWIKKFKTVAAMHLKKPFPRLDTVRVMKECDIWPSSQRDLRYSQWPEVSATFAKQCITVLDHTGRPWRPRRQLERQLEDFWKA